MYAINPAQHQAQLKAAARWAEAVNRAARTAGACQILHDEIYFPSPKAAQKFHKALQLEQEITSFEAWQADSK
jgi:hypothetical protein